MSSPELGAQPQEPSSRDKLQWCLDSLGQRITTVGVGLSDTSVVRSWKESDIPEDVEAKVSLLYDAAKAISDVYDDTTARAFLRSTQPYLGDEAPLLLITAVGSEEAEVAEARELVMTAVSAFID